MTTEADYNAWSRLVTLHGRVEQRLAEVLQAEHSLGLSEYRALCHLATTEDGELRMQELADRTGLNQSSISRLVSRLERTGLAKRVHCGGDRRGVYASITPDGRQRQAKAKPSYVGALSQALDEHAADERLAEVVRHLRAG